MFSIIQRRKVSAGSKIIGSMKRNVSWGWSKMKRILYLFFLLIFFFSAVHVIYGGVYCDPTRPPGFPANPPPAAGSTAGKNAPVPQGSEAFTVTYDLVKGWNVISFPFSRILETKGFRWKILRYSGGAYYAFDPVADVSQINTRWGYLVYSDAPARVTARGVPNNRHIRSLSLDCGWNLIGCPSSRSAPWSRIAAIISSSTQVALDVAGLPSSQVNYWICSRAYRFDRGLESVDIKADGAGIQSKQGLWLYVWHPLTLTVMPGNDQAQQLRIDRVTPASSAPGQTVSVDGSGFGTSPTGLFLSGVPITEEFILSWSPTRIMFRVPSYVESGKLMVFINGTCSNKAALAVGATNNAPAGTVLSGKVQDGNKQPLGGALVILGNGMSAYSKGDGTFIIERIPPGEYSVQGSLTGHRSAQGKIALLEGVSKALLITLNSYDEVLPVSLSNTSAPLPDKAETRKDEQIASDKGTLYAVASAHYAGEKRWWVYRIDVSEWGNNSYYWHNVWYNDVGDIYYELKCPGARIGKTYNFKIEWRTKDGSKTYTNTWQRKMYKQYQKENFDTPY